ncbi:O-antigen ligase [Geodermatophilus saharensis]|uniref:O-antigen ligase n=1 Tax=Geodermatophilus saharensis TaxID=1137994 RepID=A0A239GG53_9ACTN|nr:O-antigen ligase [Geodermatophilus saharensis]
MVAAVGTYALCLFVFPSDLVLRVVGGQGFVASLVALGLLGGWGLSVLLGLHNPLLVRHPTRGVVGLWAVTSLACWAMTPFHGLSGTQQLSADRWIMLIASSAGVVLVAAEGLETREALLSVLRLAVLGAAFCSLVAVLQWVLTLDLSGIIRQSLPGFEVNSTYSVYQPRGALTRVTGTTLHPIELGVVAGMMMPLALALAIQDRSRGAWRRWGPVALIGLSVPASVSRSAVLSVLVALVVFVVLLPARTRASAVVFLPVGALLLVLARPGYIRTLATFIGAGSDDLSVSSRLDDYPMVQKMVAEHPWLGTGGGTFMPLDALDILDNQYLKGAVELGVIGLTGVVAWLVIPVVTALHARHRSADPTLRLVAAALAGAACANAVSSATFDSLSFNMFAGLHALVVGCIGACWIQSGRQPPPVPDPSPPNRS